MDRVIIPAAIILVVALSIAIPTCAKADTTATVACANRQCVITVPVAVAPGSTVTLNIEGFDADTTGGAGNYLQIGSFQLPLWGAQGTAAGNQIWRPLSYPLPASAIGVGQNVLNFVLSSSQDNIRNARLTYTPVAAPTATAPAALQLLFTRGWVPSWFSLGDDDWWADERNDIEPRRAYFCIRDATNPALTFSTWTPVDLAQPPVTQAPAPDACSAAWCFASGVGTGAGSRAATIDAACNP